MREKTMSQIWANITGWFAHPFNTSGSALTWVLFVGILIIAVWFWTTVLHDVIE